MTGSVSRIVRYYRKGVWLKEPALVPVEEAFTITINDQELVTLMATPGHGLHLAVGFLTGEGILDNLDQVDDLEEDSQGVRVRARGVELGLRLFEKRVFTSGCGKGTSFVSALDTLAEPVRSLPEEVPWVSASVLERSALEVYKGGQLYRETGGTHAAALFDRKGRLHSLAEDIGRHNAVDKVVGEQLLGGGQLSELFLVVTGRISSDMVSKTARAGVPLVVSKSAATSLAVYYGERLSVGLVGRLARGRLISYTHSELIDSGTE